MNGKNIALLVALAVVLILPFALRKQGESILNPDGRVIVITPHNEAIRYEFGRAFREFYQEQTGKDVIVDWRVIGGTSEIVRKVESDYLSAFKNYWIEEEGRDWTQKIQDAFFNRRMQLDDTPQDDTLPEQARRLFLNSEVSCGLDVFFGGGSYDFIRQSDAGSLVSFDLLDKHPDWFDADSLPQSFAGEPYWDEEGRWFGAVLSTFGIIYNKDGLERVGYEGTPDAWQDLADPRFFGEIGLADPTKSGSITKAFEMIVQEEMQDLEKRLLEEGIGPALAEERAIREGWANGMELILLIAANSRYFTDSSTKPPLDVSQGDCVVGMSIDFYGRQQAEFNQIRSGSNHFEYVAPEGGTTVSVDPIGLFRGAPNREHAEAFIEFVLSAEGQKLWNFQPGSPGGPVQYALRRAPARKELYAESFIEYRSDPTVNDYENAGDFIYRPEWTTRLFSPLRYIIRVTMIDPHLELTEAWKAIIEAREAGREEQAQQALEILTDLSAISYEQASGPINEVLRSRNKIEEVRLSKDLANAFRAQYERAKLVASE